MHAETIATFMLWGTLCVAVSSCNEAPRGAPLRPPGEQGLEGHAAPASAVGPLTVSAENRRYFTTGRDRRAIYLTGSHTWNNFQDWGLTEAIPRLDYGAYLDFLGRHGHNFIRLYVWEQAGWFPGTDAKVVVEPLCYLRTGPGVALDGRPRFDLSKFDPGYFRRLRDRVAAARGRGIYVSVMLFNGWSVELKGQKVGNPWRGHPFNRENNISGIDGDADGDGVGKEVHTLVVPAVTALQRRYLAKVVETLGDLDNVLWEISNESHGGSCQWQFEMIRTIKTLESQRGKVHPVGMTPMWPQPPDGDAALWSSPADWISPSSGRGRVYEGSPPASDGSKVVLTDTDHLWGIGGSSQWVWKSFLRGLNPLFMDPYVTAVSRNLPAWPRPSLDSDSAGIPAAEWDGIRRAMGLSRALADRVDLTSMRPMPELASTGYCLATPGRAYLAYVPSHPGRVMKLLRRFGSVGARDGLVLDLSAVRGPLDVQWIDAERGVVLPTFVVAGGRRREFRAPIAGDGLLLANARNDVVASGRPH